jgi:hypothetical protein
MAIAKARHARGAVKGAASLALAAVRVRRA